MVSERNLFLQHLGQTSPEPLLIEIERAEGVWLYGPDGKKYLDLVSGVSVSNVGHCNPKVVEAVKKQIDKYMHLMVYGEIIQSPQVQYAKRLTELLPHQLDSVYFVNSGSEAVEGALKLVKRYTGRSRILSFRKAYHGSTHGALSVQGDELFRQPYRPLLPDTWQYDFNDDSVLSGIDGSTAAVIIEPIQAEAGIIEPENDFLSKLRDKCTKAGALLIFDEIQTGLGRTGSLFAFEHYKVVPDILLLAKALGGGLPLGAFICDREIMQTLSVKPGLGHITTFGGHPVCCSSGLAALEVILEDKLPEGANWRGEMFRKILKHELITEIRGEGLFLAVRLKSPEYVKKFINKGVKSGLILDHFLFCSDAFRIAPPLIIKKEEIEFACKSISTLLNQIKDECQ
jgi:acetylornithine/succinyldiaminopimelate/putrescine aminotransferase